MEFMDASYYLANPKSNLMGKTLYYDNKSSFFIRFLTGIFVCHFKNQVEINDLSHGDP
jgi:hypothetical protein